jgi:hypothetical protein
MSIIHVKPWRAAVSASCDRLQSMALFQLACASTPAPERIAENREEIRPF